MIQALRRKSGVDYGYTFGIRIWQRAQQNTLEHAENCRIRANTQRQCRYRYHGKPGRLRQHARAKAYVR
jgi:hypothetical protein